MVRLLSVDVGLPRDIVRKGRAIHPDLEESGAWSLSRRPVESRGGRSRATWPDTEVNSEPSSCIRLNRIAIRRSS